VSAAHRWRYASVDNPLSDGFLHDEALNISVCGTGTHHAGFVVNVVLLMLLLAFLFLSFLMIRTNDDNSRPCPFMLVCAGDWCNGSRVEGAYISGMMLSAKLMSRSSL
jgi:predicted NAD/FAD-dependent oxidoreductase